MKIFLPHQEAMFQYAKERDEIAIFAEMRLGKTLVTVRWAKHKRCKKILIAGPKDALPSWESELIEDGEDDIAYLDGSAEQRIIKSTARWNLINYEGIRICPSVLFSGYDCIILDESTRLRDPSSLTTQTLKNRSEHIPRRAILTGMPNPESELDFFTQMAICFGTFMGCKNYWQWRDKYFFQLGYTWEPELGTQSLLKRELNNKAFFITRKEAGVGSEKVYQKRYVYMNKKQQKIYDQIKNDLETELKSTKFVPVKLEWLSQIASGFFNNEVLSLEKHKVISDLLKGELRGQKLIIWFKHTAELLSVYSNLNQKGIPTGRFDAHRRDSFKDRQVLCVQAKCGQMGIDWSQASTEIYFSNWWDGEIRLQSEDRLIHPQKKEPILIIDLICKNTIEEDIVDIVLSKNNNSRNFVQQLKERFEK